jgi:PAS domain S-box-containing protein
MKEILESRFAESYGERIRWLASIPEQNPNPIAEFERDSGALSYANPAALRLAPELQREGLGHPGLAGVRTLAAAWDGGACEPARVEAAFGESWFLLTITYIVETRRLRMYGTDLSERRHLEEELERSLKEIIGLKAAIRADIAERKRGEEAAALLVAIIEASDDAIVGKDLNGIVTSWNAGAEKIFGYPAAEMIGRSITRLIPPERIEEETKILNRIKVGETVRHFETVRVRKDGRRLDVSVTVSAIKDAAGRIVGASKVARDITARKRTEEALRVSEAHYRTLFECAPDGILIVNPGKYYVDANAAMCRMLGYTRDELVGLHASDIVAESDVEHIDPTVEAIYAGANFRREWQFRRKDGSVFTVEAQAAAMPDGNHLGMIHDVTAERAGERALKEKEMLLHAADRRLADIVQGMTEACFALDKDWRFTFVNDRATTLLHHTREQMIGRSIWQIFHRLVGTPMEANYRRAMAERVPVAFEVFSPVAERWLDIRLFPTAEGLAAFLLDIHARKHTEQALREREEQLRLYAEHSPAAIAMFDREMKYLVASHRWIEVYRLGGQSVIGRSHYEVFPEISRRWIDIHRRCIEGAVEQCEEDAFPRADGTTDWIRWEVRPWHEANGTIGGIIIFSEDITARKRAAETILRLNAGLEQRVAERTAQLEMANRELEAFSYSVSHDLRAPLRAIDGFSQAVLEDFGPHLPAEGQCYLGTIRNGAQRMGALIDDLLAFSRLSRAPLAKTEVKTGSMVRSVLNELGSQLGGRKIELRIGELPACQGDPALLRQVWINLLSNAFKYTQKREGAIVEAGCEERAEGKVFFVRDNGAGFDMRYAHKLFGVFQRLHRAEDYEGTGVGLAIVQRIIDRHGGRIWAEAAVDHGATFHFTLEPESKS